MQQGKPSKVEEMKRVSHRLRGTIGPVISSDAPVFEEADKQLLKFHGVYQGYDRDSATELKQKGEAKHFEFMIRVKMPAGVLSAEQYLELDRIAVCYGGGRMRITTRQTIQFHAIAKNNLWATIHEVNQALLTTLGACGDVVRNVTATAAPFEDDRHRALREEAVRISRDLAPKTKAYHEIWVGNAEVKGLEAPTEEPEIDPLYGPTYLPRKFKIGLAMPENNDVDVLTNDAALIAIFDGQRLLGYNLAIGGGQGMTHNRPATYPRLASYVGFLPPDGVLDALKAVIALQRDNGDRSDRRHARLKYVIDAMGLDWIKADLERRLGHPLEAVREMAPFAIPDLSGWHEQGDGKWFFGLPVPSGRIDDLGKQHWATAFRRIFTELPCRPVMAPEPGYLRRRRSRSPSRAHRGHPDRRRRPFAGQGSADTPLGARLPRSTDLRAGPERGGAGLERCRKRARDPPQTSSRQRRADQFPHDGLPQWLRTVLYRRYRARRAHARHLCHLSRR